MKNERIQIWLTILICVLITWSGITGLFVTDLYAGETHNWRAQTLRQDSINLILVVPLLLNTALISHFSQEAKLLWAGGILYTIYTYTIYCFDIHFNYLFPIYCGILGLSIFSLIWFVYKQIRVVEYHPFNPVSAIVTGIYMMLTAAFFALIWAAEICVAILTELPPASIKEGGFFTNPVQVIDLAVCLPGIFITGLLLVKQEKPGQTLAPVILTFMLLMDLTVGILSIQTEPDMHLTGITFLMFSLAFTSILLLIINLRRKLSLS